MSSSSSSYDPMNKRVDFKLHGARMHLLNLKRLESIDGELSSTKVRLAAEIEINEFFYHLVGVKDALLQEINSELYLGLEPKDVKEETINSKLEEKYGEAAKDDLMCRINMMKSDKTHPLGKINELYNHSKHRNMLYKHIAISVPEGVTNFALIDPITGKPMNNQIIDYLEDSYKRIEILQIRVRKEISKYRVNLKPNP